MLLIEVIMFSHRLFNVPDAGQPFWKFHKITLAELDPAARERVLALPSNSGVVPAVSPSIAAFEKELRDARVDWQMIWPGPALRHWRMLFLENN